MSNLQSKIIALLEDAPGNRASHAYIINEVDLLDADHSLADLDESLDTLREERGSEFTVRTRRSKIGKSSCWSE